MTISIAGNSDPRLAALLASEPAGSEAPAAEDAAAGAPDGALAAAPGARDLALAQNYLERLSRAREAEKAASARGGPAEREQARACYQLAEQLLCSALAALPEPGAALRAALASEPAWAFAAARGRAVPRSGANASPSSDSSVEFWKRIGANIDILKSGYLDVFEGAFRKNNDLYKKFTDQIISKLGEWTEAGEKTVTLDIGSDAEGGRSGLLGALSDLRDANKWGATMVFKTYETSYVGEDGAVVTDPEKVSARNKAVAEKWATDLGLTPSDDENGKYVLFKSGGDDTSWQVQLDWSPIEQMIGALKKLGSGKKGLSTATYQAWKIGFDAQADQLKNTASAMASKMASAQSTFENLIKILSSTIAAMSDTDLSYLKP